MFFVILEKPLSNKSARVFLMRKFTACSFLYDVATLYDVLHGEGLLKIIKNKAIW